MNSGDHGATRKDRRAAAERRRGVRPGRRMACAAVCAFAAVAAAGAADLSVDGEAALRRVEAFVSLGPRPSGSAGAAAAADWLEEACLGMGLDTTQIVWTEETVVGPVTFRNVRAVLPGARTGIIVLGTHYDTKVLPECPQFVGANDSGSSTGLVLEILRTLGASTSWQGCTVEAWFFDGEECVQRYGPKDGLHGSRHAVKVLTGEDRLQRVRAMVLLDMIGDRDLTLTLSRDTPPLLRRILLRAAERRGVRNRIRMYRHGTILDDHVPFQKAGVPAIDLIDFEFGPGNRYWHTEEDTLDKLSAESLEIVGNLCLDMLRALSPR